ncbi:terminase gpP N-terminus-related DNA-binding protein [Pseudomonas viridiflava]|uniref:terminase gpP N-terminus-related DNA-binding protein n=1 Tax=Pseudomonas viridiflava TaxID=33069 RepID=UPI000F0337D5
MDLNSWIEELNGQPLSLRLGITRVQSAASVLGEKPRTVYSWYRRDRAPSLQSAQGIIKASLGRVDYNGIYQPFEAKTASSARGHEHA